MEPNLKNWQQGWEKSAILADSMLASLELYCSKEREQISTIDFLTNDGSDRDYLRIGLASGNSRVIMKLINSDLAELKEGSYRWLQMQKYLHEKKLRVPNVHFVDSDAGYICLEDCGSMHLKLQGNQKQSKIFTILTQMLSLKNWPPSEKHVFSQQKFFWELEFFLKQFLEPLFPDFDPSLMHKLRLEFLKLSTELSRHSHYFCHRDLHSRNIMETSEKELILIDFQDAMLGPATYDLASLVGDSYLHQSSFDRTGWLLEGCQNLSQNTTHYSCSELEALCLKTVLQRQIKALGSYGFLSLNKKRGNYLHYTANCLNILKELTDPILSEWPATRSMISILQSDQRESFQWQQPVQ